FSARRISEGPRHGRHGRASSRSAADAGAPFAAFDQIAGATGDVEGGSARSRLQPRRTGAGCGAGRPTRVNESAATRKTALPEVIARLSTLHPKRIDLTLDRIRHLLERLDHPERKLPPVIHVAGTNGKGSTVAYLRAILEAAGLRVHAYTSPYLVRINESF